MKRVPTILLALMAVGLLTAASWLQLGAPLGPFAVGQDNAVATAPHHLTLFEPLTSDKYDPVERFGLACCFQGQLGPVLGDVM